MERLTHRANELVTAAGQGAQAMMSFKKTLAGSPPHAVAFSDYDLPNMKDALYRILPHGETSARLTVDESTITEQGFSLLGGADAEVAHIFIHGRIEGTPEV